MEITAEIPRVSIKEARATDGEKGAISLDGWFDLLPGDQFPFKTALTLEHATIIRRDDITATAGGRVILAGSVEKANLAGQLHVEHAEVRIPDRLSPDITDLQVIEVRETDNKGNLRRNHGPIKALSCFLIWRLMVPAKSSYAAVVSILNGNAHSAFPELHVSQR